MIEYFMLSRAPRPPVNVIDEPTGRLPRRAWQLTLVLCLASTADWYVMFAVFWISAERGWSGAQLALLVIAGRAPTFVGGVVGGRAVDRFGPRTMILVDAASRALLCAALLVAVLVGGDGYWPLLVVSALCAAASPISYAGSRALLPRLVRPEQLDRATAVLSSSDVLPIILAAVLAGPALVWLGSGAFAVPCVLMVLVGVAARTLPRVEGVHPPSGDTHPRGRGPSPWRSSSVVALICLSTLYFLVYGPFAPLLPVLIRDNLDGGATTYAVMRVAVGLGAICSLPFAPWLSRLGRPGVVNAVGAVIYGVTLFPLVLLHTTVWAVLLYFVTGVVWGPYAAVEATALQRWTRPEQLGRVFGTQRALVLTAIPLGGAVGSLALEYTSAATIIGISAIACSVTGLVALAFAPIRRRATAVDGADAVAEHELVHDLSVPAG